MIDGPLKVLLVSHFFAPSPSAGANRATAFARHLRAEGHEVAVLTNSAYGSLPEDGAVGNVRTWDLRLLQAGPARRLRAADASSTGAPSTTVHPLGRVLVPDIHVLTWAPFALAAAALLSRRRRFDCVWTTSPPESTHLIGAALRRRIPWVADLRDGWAFEPWIKQQLWPTRIQHRLNEWLERHVLGAADALTAVSPMVVDYLQRDLGFAADVLPNGWEPRSVSTTVDVEGVPELDPSRVSAIYTGEIAGARRDAAPLIRALVALAREDPDSAARLELVFAGSFTADEQRLLGTECSPARILNAGRLGREQVSALQLAADAAVDLTPRAGRQATSSKLYEYMGAGLPIVALAPADGAVRRIVAEANGVVVGTHDESAIKAALRALARREVGAPSEDTRREYSWPVLTERLVELMRGAIARRRDERSSIASHGR